MKSLNIGIDIDDTITNTLEYLMPYVADFFKVDIEKLKEVNVLYSTLSGNIKDGKLDLSKTVFDNVILGVPLKEFADMYLNKLKSDGHRLYFITARTNEVYKDAYGLTIKYLNKHNIPYDKVICTKDKAKACKENEVDLFIDDSVTHCINVAKEGIDVLMFNCENNKQFHNFNKVCDWKEIYNYINKKI